MKQKIFIIFLPSIVWFIIAALNIGAQSLSNLLEVVIIFFISFLSSFIPNKKIDYRIILLILIGIVFLFRIFMPILPE